MKARSENVDLPRLADAILRPRRVSRTHKHIILSQTQENFPNISVEDTVGRLTTTMTRTLGVGQASSRLTVAPTSTHATRLTPACRLTWSACLTLTTVTAFAVSRKEI